MSKLPLIGAACAITLLAACIDDDKPKQQDDDKEQLTFGAQTALSANRNVAVHLDGVAAVLKILDESKLLEEVFPKQEAAPCPEPVDPSMPKPPCEQPAAVANFDFSADTEEVKDWLAENVFNEALVETQTDTSVTYKVSTATCTTTHEDNTTSTDEDCVKLLTELPVRVIVTKAAIEGDVDLVLTIGTHRPLEVELYAARIAAKADLAVVKATVLAVLDLFEEEISEDVPERVSGKVQVALLKNADKDYTASFSILEAVNVGHKAPTDLKYVDVTLAAANDVLSVRMKAGEKTVLAAVNLGVVDAAAALDLIAHDSGETTCSYDAVTGQETCVTAEGETRQGTIALHLGGLNGSGLLSVEEDTIALTGLGLGNETSTVKYNGTQILAVDVNTAANRRFDVTIAETDTGPTFTVSPSFALAAAHDFTTLAAALGTDGEDIPAWVKGGDSSITLDGAPAPAVKIVDSTETTDGGVKVLAGKLTIDGSAVSPLEIEANACLIDAEGDQDEDLHPVTWFTSGTCGG